MPNLDRGISLRLDIETLHRVEQVAAKWNETRLKLKAEGRNLLPGLPFEGANVHTAFTVSDVIRKALNCGLRLWDNDEDFIRDWAWQFFESDLKLILAAGYHDPKAATLLRRIARESSLDPDFG
jgi:hypothetical protein